MEKLRTIHVDGHHINPRPSDLSVLQTHSHAAHAVSTVADRPLIAPSPDYCAFVMLRRILAAVRADELKNTGSLARDLLASERTFLAWTRTGLGFIALGVALEKVEAFAAISPTLLHLENSRTKLAAGVLVASGSLCVAHGTHRYFDTMKSLQKGMFRPNVVGVSLAAATCLGIAFAGTLLVLQNEGGQHRKDVRDAAVQTK